MNLLSNASTDRQSLIEATKEIERLKAACNIALWIHGKLEERGAFGAGFDEWNDIRTACAHTQAAADLSEGPRMDLAGDLIRDMPGPQYCPYCGRAFPYRK